MVVEEDENAFVVDAVDNEEEGERDYCEEVLQDDALEKPLDSATLRAARLEELSFMRKIAVWEEVDQSECEETTGRGPTTVRWVDVAKEGGVRSRLAACDFKPT